MVAEDGVACEGFLGPLVTFFRAVVVFGISFVMGFPSLSQLASGFLEFVGGSRMNPPNRHFFSRKYFSKSIFFFFSVPSKSPKPWCLVVRGCCLGVVACCRFRTSLKSKTGLATKRCGAGVLQQKFSYVSEALHFFLAVHVSAMG